MEKKVTLTTTELKRIHVIHEINARRMTAKKGAEVLGISLRQMRRLIKKQREKGDGALAHGNRGKQSPQRIGEEVRRRIVELAKTKYPDYNDTHLWEKLQAEADPIEISRSTVRSIRREAGMGSPRKRRPPRHRQRRERCLREGMMLQTDGSEHDWLEGRGPKLTLIAYIDDATNKVPGGIFREQEDAAGYMIVLQKICLTLGIPLSIYADRHTIFQSSAKSTLEQELSGEQPKSQFGRLLDELGIELIPAKSPQAKGRIERLWGTFQDRLVKALREANACTLEQANRVLAVFLEQYNQRFTIEAVDPENVYMPWPNEFDPQRFFVFRYQRTVMNDNTIAFNNHHLQIPPSPERASFAKAKVDLHHHMDGRLSVLFQGKTLVIFLPAEPGPPRVDKFKPAPQISLPQPAQLVQSHNPRQASKQPHKPAPGHPWRKPLLPQNAKRREKTVDNSSVSPSLVD
jgi:transposase